ncbi:MAG: hypothetical protein ACO35E_00420 [Ilumatobacteraceae bacterium]
MPEASFVPIQPTRVMDTRRGLGGPALSGGETRLLDLSSLAAQASSVSLNVTVVGPSADTFVTVWPGGQPVPDTSNLNLRAGEIRANAVLVGLGSDASIALLNAFGRADVIVDVLGWSSDSFVGVTPTRLVDTRKGRGGGRMSNEQVISFQAAGVAGVPAEAVAIAANVTAVDPSREGFLTVWPTGSSRPDTSNVNFAAGMTVPNLVVVGTGEGGRVSVYHFGGSTDVLVDVTGWFAPDGGFRPLTSPTRLMDTRRGTCGVRLLPGEIRNLRVTERQDVGAVALNVTAVGATAQSFVTVWPAGSSRPDASTLNTVASGPATPNFISVGVGDAGEISLYNDAGTVDLIVDLFGTFEGSTPSGDPSPCPEFQPSPVSRSDLIVVPTPQLAIGEDRVAVWVCRVPQNTTNSFYSQWSDRLDVTPEGAADHARTVAKTFFESASKRRYRMTFTPVGYIDIAADQGPDTCESEAAARSGPPFTNALVVDDTPYGGGRATNGIKWIQPELPNDSFVQAPSATRRFAWVGGGTVAGGAVPSDCARTVVHELGHTLAWPHSHYSPDDEYDNPMDIVSGTDLTNFCGSVHTLAFNRFVAGWIDREAVVVHQSGRSTVDLSPPAGGGTEMLVAPMPGQPEAMLTLEARPLTGFDADNWVGGVAVHFVDQRSCLYSGPYCRRQGPAYREPLSDEQFLQGNWFAIYDSLHSHVLEIGESRTFDGVTVTVLSGSPSGGFWVTTEGTYEPQVTQS